MFCCRAGVYTISRSSRSKACQVQATSIGVQIEKCNCLPRLLRNSEACRLEWRMWTQKVGYFLTKVNSIKNSTISKGQDLLQFDDREVKSSVVDFEVACAIEGSFGELESPKLLLDYSCVSGDWTWRSQRFLIARCPLPPRASPCPCSAAFPWTWSWTYCLSEWSLWLEQLTNQLHVRQADVQDVQILAGNIHFNPEKNKVSALW